MFQNRRSLPALVSCAVLIGASSGCAGTGGRSASSVAGETTTSDSRERSTEEAGEIQSLLARADIEMSGSRWIDALELFDEILAIDADNADAQLGRSRALARLDIGSSIDGIEREIRLRREAALDEFDARCLRATEEMASHRYNAALSHLLSAKLALRQDEQFIPSVVVRRRLERADALTNEVETARESYARLNR